MIRNLIIVLKILLLMITTSFIIWPLLTKFRKKYSFDENFKPLATVVIPAYNEQENIERCIKSVLDSKYEQLEVIVVNDGSSDRTVEIVENFPKVKLISIPRSGRSGAINVGIEHAEGKIILVTDADCVVNDEWVPKLVRHFSDSKVGAVAGPTLSLKRGGNIFESIQNLYNLVIFHYLKYCMDSVGGLIALSGACTALRKSTLTARKYDETLCSFENFELAFGIVKGGYKIQFEPDAPVRSAEPKRFKIFLSRHHRWFSNLHKVLFRHLDLLKPSFGGYSFTYTLFAIQTIGLLLVASSFVSAVFLYNLSSPHKILGELSFLSMPYVLFTVIFMIITILALKRANESTPQNILLSPLWSTIAFYYAGVILTSMIFRPFQAGKGTFKPARD